MENESNVRYQRLSDKTNETTFWCFEMLKQTFEGMDNDSCTRELNTLIIVT